MASLAVAGAWVAANAGTIAAVGAVASAAGTGLAAYESHQAGVAASNMDKAKARAEAISEEGKQINMRQNLLKALASQNAGSLGAVGTGGGSGFGANTRRQLTEAQDDLMTSKANASARISLLDQSASSARAAGNIGAAGDVLSGTTQLAFGK